MVKDGSGWGAHAGVSAALLAREGFTGAPALTVERDDAAPFWRDLGTRWRIGEQYFKAYPVCRWAQPAIEAALELQRAHRFAAADIAGIAIESFREAVALGSQCALPTRDRRGAVQPSVSGRRGARVRSRRRGRGRRARPQRSAQVARLVAATTATEDAAFSDRFPAERWARVRITLGDGRTLVSEPARARGNPENPLSDDELRAKYRELAAPVLGAERAARIERAVDTLAVDPTALRATARGPAAARARVRVKMTGPAKSCVVLAALCLMAACAVIDSNRPPSGSIRAASYETTPCPQPNIAGFPDLDFPSDVRCGYLTVLENRAKPDGRRIRIFVMRAPAVSATPKPDPIVYLSGGPGGAGSFEVAFMVEHGLNADREVIFVDQRGTHHADPRLGCPEWEQYVYDAVSLPFAAESTTAADAAAVKACRDQWAATGVDLAAYNSTENAADIAELRVALGIDSWNVYGVSYGSKLALIVLRDHPQGIRSVVLDSVSPPDEQHRRELVVGAGQLVQGDLRRLCGPARLRRRLPEPGSGLHGHGEPPRRRRRSSRRSRTCPARR